MIDALADLFLHPGAATPATATEALVAMVFHLHDAVTVEDVEDVARLIVDIVVAPDVAGIVIGQLALIEARGELDFLVV